MKSRLLLVLAALTVLSAPMGLTSATHAAPGETSKLCKSVNKKFPHGVAIGSSGVNLAVINGMMPPKVAPKLALNLILKLPVGASRLGGVCLVRAPKFVPAVPQDLRASSVGETYLFLSWSRIDDRLDPVSYEVTGGGRLKSFTNSFAHVTDLAPGTRYEFTLVARNSVGASSPALITVTTLSRITYSDPSTGEPAPLPSFADGSGGGGAGVYFATCADARAAGVALPIRRQEQPALYAANPQLDRDGDGVSCEWG